MTKLDDMEELLLTIKDNSLKEYMSEAHRCYSAGAFRGCVIMCFISTFHHLVARLAALAPQNKKADDIYSEITKKIEGQLVYETYLIDRVRKEGLIKEIDAFFLDLVRDLRNKSAHPSGHTPSAEEARLIFKETVTRFLKDDIITPSSKIEEIVSNMSHKHYVVTSNFLETKEFVAKEITGVPVDAIPMLCSKLYKLRQNSTDDMIIKNTKTFVWGMAAHDDTDVSCAVVRSILSRHLSNEKESSLFLGIVSASSCNIWTLLNDTDLKRLSKHYHDYRTNLSKGVSKLNIAHPSKIAATIIDRWPEEPTKALKDEIKAQIDSDFYHPSICLSCLSSPKHKDYYFSKLLDAAGSSDYGTANTCAKSLQQLDETLATCLSGDDAVALLGRVWRSADIGAFDSKNVRNTKFSLVDKVRSKAIQYVSTEQATAATLFNKNADVEMSWIDIATALTPETENGEGEESADTEA